MLIGKMKIRPVILVSVLFSLGIINSCSKVEIKEEKVLFGSYLESIQSEMLCEKYGGILFMSARGLYNIIYFPDKTIVSSDSRHKERIRDINNHVNTDLVTHNRDYYEKQSNAILQTMKKYHLISFSVDDSDVCIIQFDLNHIDERTWPIVAPDIYDLGGPVTVRRGVLANIVNPKKIDAFLSSSRYKNSPWIRLRERWYFQKRYEYYRP